MKFKFARAYVNVPFATNLYFYGISLYEQLKKINKDEMEKIEQELHNSISKAYSTYSKQQLENIMKKLKNIVKKKSKRKKSKNYLKEAAILPPSTVSTAPVVFFETAK